MLRALVFDFDGLIADTEAPEFQAWSEVWAEHGHDLTLDDWCKAIGTVDGFDPLGELAARVGDGFDARAAQERRRGRHRVLMDEVFPLPGVVELLGAARAAGLPAAVASSAPPWWVEQNLRRFRLTDRFAAVRAYDGSCPPKPAPDLYLAACEALEVEPADAVAFEDSPNGIAAAKAAGLYCVAVPHDLTRHLDLSAADVVVESLAEVTIPDLRRRLA